MSGLGGAPTLIRPAIYRFWKRRGPVLDQSPMRGLLYRNWRRWCRDTSANVRRPATPETCLDRQRRHQTMVLGSATHPDTVRSAAAAWMRLYERPAAAAHPGRPGAGQGRRQACEREASWRPSTAAAPRRGPRWPDLDWTPTPDL